MLDIFLTSDAWISLLTLTALEIVLGIDNLVFISILADKLPPHERAKARKLGLGFALITRLLLLFTISWIMKLTEPFITIMVRG
jgi:predicted tellurium resistance membrane protein TerC